MLQCDFGLPDENNKFIKVQEKAAAFNIYCFDYQTDCYLLVPNSEQTDKACPLIYVDSGNWKFVFPEGDEQSEFNALKQKACSAEQTIFERLPSDVQTLLYTPLFQEKADK